MDAVLVESRVREQIRTLDLDPVLDSTRVLHLIQECASDLFAGGSLIDVPALVLEVHHQISGYGPLQKFFDDSTVEEIWINEPNRVFIARGGRSELTGIVLTPEQVRDLVERMLRTSGRRLDLSQPFVDAVLSDGSRLHVVIPEVTQKHWSVNIRRFVVRPKTIFDLVGLGTLNQQAAVFLDAAVQCGLNTVVAGGTHAGKTTLLNALLGCVPRHERVISCEEVFEIRIDRTAHHHHYGWASQPRPLPYPLPAPIT